MKKALEGLPGVSEVAFEPRSDTFAIERTSTPVVAEEVRSAVLGQVVFPRLRRLFALSVRLVLMRTRLSKKPAQYPW